MSTSSELCLFAFFTDWSHGSFFCCDKAFSVERYRFEENGLFDDKGIIPVSRWGLCYLLSSLWYCCVISIYCFGQQWILSYYSFLQKVIIVTSSLMKDMNSKTDMYRANAIRVLCRITDGTLLTQIERYLKQAIVDKNPVVASAALVSGIHLLQVILNCLSSKVFDTFF